VISKKTMVGVSAFESTDGDGSDRDGSYRAIALAKVMIDKPLKISQLLALVTVADEGGFSAAALQLGLAQSTVSHAIAMLEAELGVVLLLRNRSGAVLTPMGAQICQQARGVLAQLKEIRQTATQAKELQTGRVRVAAVRTVATHVLPGVISTFRRLHPGLSVEISEYDRYFDVEQAIKNGQVDLGFTLLPAPLEFQAWELFREDFVALLPPDKTDRDEPLSWTDIAGYARIVNARSVAHNDLVSDHLAAFDCRLSVDYSVREDSTLMNLVEQGLGVAILARLEAEPVPVGVRVKTLPEPLERVVGVAMLEKAVLPRAVFVFLDVLLALPVG